MESFAIRSQLVLLGTSHTIHSSAILNRKEHLQPKAAHPGWFYLLRKVGALSQHQLQSRFPKLSSGCRLSNPRHRFIAASFWCKRLSLGRDPLVCRRSEAATCRQAAWRPARDSSHRDSPHRDTAPSHSCCSHGGDYVSSRVNSAPFLRFTIVAVWKLWGFLIIFALSHAL